MAINPSVVHIIDVLPVNIAVVLIAALVKQGKELKHCMSTGQIGEGHGAKAGTTHRLKDGTMVHVPEEAAAGAAK